ncbi:F-box only protein 12 [Linum perenne]
MADRTSKSRRWELGLRSHREELSSISKRTDNPEDRNHENKKEKRKWKMQKQRKREMKWKMQKQRKRERKMMEYQNKANYHSKDGDVAEEEEEEEDRKHKDKMEKRKMQKQRKKREMKMMEYQNKANYHSNVAEADSSTVVVVDYDLLVSEILSRLPAKSLMRCKCVCKAWKSTIEHDSHFINLHHTRSQAHPRFLIASFPPYRCKSGEGYDESSFFSADLHYNDGGIEASIDTVTRVPKSMHTAQRCFGPVRGLVCLIDRLFASQIRNVSTSQSTPWINSEAATVMYRKHLVKDAKKIDFARC